MKSAIMYTTTLAFVAFKVYLTGSFTWCWWIIIGMIYNALF